MAVKAEKKVTKIEKKPELDDGSILNIDTEKEETNKDEKEEVLLTYKMKEQLDKKIRGF